MKLLLAWIGPVVFAGLVVNFALSYKAKWEFGRLGMPAALLAEDGRHHPDGSEVEHVTLLIAQSGNEQAIYFGLMLVLLALVAVLVKEIRQLYRMKMELRLMELQYLLGRDKAAPGTGGRSW